MPKSTKPRRTKKSGRHYPKPFDGFPLSAHVHTNRWYKTHRGVRHYFGPLDDWRAAQRRYEHDWPYILEGRTPPPMPTEGDDTTTGGPLTIAQLVDAFLLAKRRLVDSGELSERMFADYYGLGQRVLKDFGRNTVVERLTPDDFGRVRAKWAVGRSAVTLGNLVNQARIIFKFAQDEGLTDKVIRYGAQFSKPRRKTLRLERREKPRKFFDAHEVRLLVRKADTHLRAMILLACNAGLGNKDLSDLTLDAVDLKAGMVTLHREKTGVDRRATLWPETVKALRRSLEKRPRPKVDDAREAVFVTKYGQRWVRYGLNEQADANGRITVHRRQSDAVGQEFNKLLKVADLKREGRGFYSLRHSFRTIADEVPDRPAVDVVMGHENTRDMRTEYVDRISVSDERLRRVTDHVRFWLWPRKAPKPTLAHGRQEGTQEQRPDVVARIG